MLVGVLSFNNMTELSKKSRKNKYYEQHGRCYYCGTDLDMVKIEEDHIIPFSKSRNGTVLNLCLSCSDCNRKKSDHTPEVFKQIVVIKYPEKLIRGMFYYEFIKLNEKIY